MSTTLLSNIRIVLVNTSHPGNIGSTARALKTMGLERLYLVNPKFFPDKKATELASQAGDVLEKAVVVNSFIEAIKDCSLVLGTSSRIRALPWPTKGAREAAPMIVQEAQQQQVALVFGSEKYGLSNEELQHCQYQIDIPSNPIYNSLNLAAAVQVICYEIRMAWLEKNVGQVAAQQLPDNIVRERYAHPDLQQTAEKFSTIEELEKFYTHLEQTLYAIEFLRPHIPNQVIERLRRLYARTRLQESELNILRGILTAVQKKL
jgi:tRNA (cytidine32/uridine32-2'-O)-methyltransferase